MATPKVRPDPSKANNESGSLSGFRPDALSERTNHNECAAPARSLNPTLAVSSSERRTNTSKDAVLLVFQGVGGQRGDGGAEERSGDQRDPSLRRSVPQHQAREYSGRRSRQVSSHVIGEELFHQRLCGKVRSASTGWRGHRHPS